MVHPELKQHVFLRFKHLWRSCSIYPVEVWESQQTKGSERDLHSFYVCYRHKQHPVCVWRSHRCHHQEQP